MRGIQGVEQQSLLHWGEWVNIFDERIVSHQPVQLSLIEFDEGEIGGGMASGRRRSTVLDKRPQRLQILFGETLNGAARMNVCTIRPSDMKLPSAYASVHLKEVTPKVSSILAGPHRFRSECKKARFRNYIVELSEVIELNLRLRITLQLFPEFGRPEIAQQSIANSSVRDSPQLFFNGLQRGPWLSTERTLQTDREYACKPADGARHIETRQDVLAAMTLQIQGNRV